MPPELLAPAGSFDAALAAFQYGADAVYLGLPRFSARADADNLTPERLRLLLAYARSLTPARRVYVTFNTLVQQAELAEALETLDTLDDLAPDGLIVQDLGVARLARDHFPRLALHASTQLAVHNLDGVLALRDLGFTRVVLARELTLGEVRDLVRRSGTEIEIFVHGALCYSYSGLCLFSAMTAGRSGNRGRCAYCCREPFRPAGQPEASPSHPFSMRDLALAPQLDDVAATGAHSLKIEGRMKSPLYVACVTDYYRRTLDHTLSPAAARTLVQDLQTIFSRPWTSLYAASAEAPARSIIDPLAVGHRGARIGRVEAVVRDRDGTCWLRFTTDRALEKHDGLQVEPPGGGQPFGCAIDRLRLAGARQTSVSLPARVTAEVALPPDGVPTLPAGAPVFCSASQAVRRRYPIASLRESELPSGRPADLQVALAPEGLSVTASAAAGDGPAVTAAVRLSQALPASRQPDQTAAAARKAFGRLGTTAWRLGTLTLEDPDARYAPPSLLNEARRTAVAALDEAWRAHRASRRDALARTWAAPAPTPAAACRPPPRWSLKLRADTPPTAPGTLDGLHTLVLALGHAAPETAAARLAAWRRAAGAATLLRPALPALARGAQPDALRRTVRALADLGWTDWECADLAGYRLLHDCGLRPRSADWTLYALNRAAAARLADLALETFVLSPEATAETARALLAQAALGGAPAPEHLLYQHTPLFLSETPPALAADAPTPTADAPLALADRRGRRFHTFTCDGRWVTVAEEATRAAPPPEAGLLRIDLSWTPRPAVAETVRALLLRP